MWKNWLSTRTGAFCKNCSTCYLETIDECPSCSASMQPITYYITWKRERIWLHIFLGLILNALLMLVDDYFQQDLQQILITVAIAFALPWGVMLLAERLAGFDASIVKKSITPELQESFSWKIFGKELMTWIAVLTGLVIFIGALKLCSHYFNSRP